MIYTMGTQKMQRSNAEGKSYERESSGRTVGRG